MPEAKMPENCIEDAERDDDRQPDQHHAAFAVQHQPEAREGCCGGDQRSPEVDAGAADAVGQSAEEGDEEAHHQGRGHHARQRFGSRDLHGLRQRAPMPLKTLPG
ncbi:hypothetical protein G6F24_015940 [Rhizopus arrhizus]|nr:hypothetical protein G6F24_015940 [Rhizopus arrhizus]